MSDGTRQPVTANTAQVSPQKGTKGLGVGFLRERMLWVFSWLAGNADLLSPL